MTDKAVAAPSSPTSASSFSAPGARAIAPQPSAEAADMNSPSVENALQQTPTQTTPKSSGARKRVFTFQKRWLHSLPIVERTLPDTEVDARVLKAERSAEGASAEAAAAEQHKDVIVCMLCDDPASKRELTKVWSRLNCRRGRIENHLMSKHPEFMRLLKHKREAEGDTAVQIFLENMRSGRCNVRNEINVGLYNQLQTGVSAAEGDNQAVRSALAVTAGADHGELQKRALDYGVREQLMDLENMRKRAKLSGEKDDPSLYSAGGMMMLHTTGALGQGREHMTEADAAAAAAIADATATGVLHLDATMMTQWQSVFFNKLVVITGGDSKAMTAMATQLWLFGANIVLTFSSLSALDDFNTKHIGRFPDPSSDSEGMGRGGMMPTMCTFQTHTDIDAWSRSIAAKFQRVDYLINYADSETDNALVAGTAADLASDDAKSEPDTSSDDRKSESIVSSATLIEVLCKSMHMVCFPAVGDDGSSMPSNGSIVNIAPAKDDCAVETLTKALAVELEPRNVQVNSILLSPRQAADAPKTASDVLDDVATLSHSILFLLSPASRLLSGSVLRLQPNKLSPVDAANRRAEVSPSAATLAGVGGDGTPGDMEGSAQSI